MPVFRRKYREGGRVKTSRYWSIRFISPTGKLIRRTTKCTSKRAAEAMELELRQSEEAGLAGIISRAESGKEFAKQVEEYKEHLKSLKRDDMYCYTTEKRLKRMAAESDWTCIADVSATSFESWRREAGKKEWRGRKLQPKTLNQFLDTIRGFLDWYVRMNKVKRNPLEHVSRATVADNRDYRRAATVEEFKKLLEKCGEERALFYRFAVYCPLRRDTLQKLRWEDLKLDSPRPYEIVRAETFKGRTTENFPIPLELAEELKRHRGEKIGKELVWPCVPTALEIAEDWVKAEVSFSDAKGRRRLDLHSFRRTALAWAKSAGVPIDEAKALLHHKDIYTTLRYYNEEPDPTTIEALKKMPKL